MSGGIQEIPLNCAEEVQDIPEDTAEYIAEEIKAEEGSEAAVLEEAKPVIKPKAKGRPRGSCNKGPSKPRAKKTQIQEAPLLWRRTPDYTSPPPQRGISNYLRTQALVKSRQLC